MSWALIIAIIIPWNWWVVARRNSLRDKNYGQYKEPFVVEEDLTDRQNKSFRYTT